MKGGVKFYRGSAASARTYVESDRSRVDDYYLAEGTGLAAHYVATPGASAEGGPDVPAVQRVGTLDGDAYEQWVAGYDIAGAAKGRLRTDEHGLRFLEVTVNGPKTWSLVAAVDPEIAAAYDAAQDRAATEIIGWLADHMTTRVGPRGRQVQVPVEKLEAAVVRHYTSRAGDPHRHLHLQINARVYAAGGWRGIHSVAMVDSIEAINGIGHAAVVCDPEFRAALAAKGYTLDPTTAEVVQLVPYAGEFSARAAQITRNIDRYEAAWRRDHPGEEPGRKLKQVWDRRAWSQARPDKVVPADGEQLERRWLEELADLGFVAPSPLPSTDPNRAAQTVPIGAPIGALDRDAAAELVLVRLGGRRSGWNAADIRGEVEKIIASPGVVATAPVRGELAEDLVARAEERCVPLLPDRDDVPTHVRALTSPRVLAVEADLVARLASRGSEPVHRMFGHLSDHLPGHRLDPAQAQVVTGCATADLLVVEGAAGTGKTATLAAAREVVARRFGRMVVVTPTLKAAQVAAAEVGADAFSAAWLVHQHGYRWDTDGHWTRLSATEAGPIAERARLWAGDLLVIDEAGMLDQDTALALLTIAGAARARVAFFGDRHQLPAVGRGGVLDHAARWANADALLTLDTVHRFSDPDYADLTVLMRTGERAAEVFDALLDRGQIAIYSTEVEQRAALSTLGAQGARIIAQTREQVAALNAEIRDQRTLFDHATRHTPRLTTAAGERIGLGDRVATRRNDPDLQVANRDTWTVTAVDPSGGLRVTGRNGDRSLPPAYAAEFVELAYATTVHGAQGETVDRAHLLVGESTGAAAAYVGMTRGRQQNTAHLVAETVDDARARWVDVFSRDRADLGPTHAARQAIEARDLYGLQLPTPAWTTPVTESRRMKEPEPSYMQPERGYSGPSF